MIKHCKVCGKEMDCYDKKRKGNKRGHNKLAYNRVTCSRPCSQENVKRVRKEYYKILKFNKSLKQYQKEYREKKRAEKNG